jgi:exopolysaccharide biosynthesis polyprenyl glycosylphosphotransferase
MATAAASFTASRAHSRAWSAALFVMDVVFITLGAIVAARIHALPVQVLVAIAMAVLALLAIAGTYRRSFSGSMRDEWYAIGAALAIVTVPMILLTLVVPALFNSRTAIGMFAGIAFFGIAATRTVAHRTRVQRRLAVVGVPERIDLALMHLRPRRDDCLLRLPVANIESTFSGDRSTPPWMQGALAWGATRVIVTEALPPDQLLRLMEVAAQRGTTIAISPPRLRSHAYKMHLEREGGLSLLCVRPLPILTPAARFYKRAFDLVLSVPAVVLLLPIFLLCALAVRLETPGPIIFRQARVGRNGKSFDILKFRSMPIDAESKTGPVWANPAISRPTRVGRFLRRTSMDELPQFFNVLRGDMSLVGPRPERAHFVERFRHIPRYEDRLLVAPGITGWSQIGMSRVLTTDKIGLRLEGDLFYLEEWSLLLDAQILVKTAFEFLFHWVPQ